MIKKLAIAAAVLALIAAIAAGIALNQLNGSYGIFTSETVHHDTLALPDTRLRVSIDTLQLGADMVPYLPENPPLPGWLPWDLPSLLPKVLPREVAVLGGSDFADGAYNLVVFVNEQRGGPALPEYLNNQYQFQKQFPAVTWAPEGFQLERRGVLSAQGHIPLPLDLEDTILQTWSLDLPETPLTLFGGHMAEAVVDNRNGEIITLIAALAPVWNSSLEQMKQNPQLDALLTLLLDVTDIRLAIDFKSTDILLLQFRIHAAQSVGGQLEFFIPLAIPMLSQQLQLQYGLTLESENEWNPNDEVYTADLSIIGVEEKLKEYFKTVVPAAPAPQ